MPVPERDSEHETAHILTYAYAGDCDARSLSLYVVVEGHEDCSPEVEPMFRLELPMMNEHVDLLTERDELESGQGAVVLNRGDVVTRERAG